MKHRFMLLGLLLSVALSVTLKSNLTHAEGLVYRQLAPQQRLGVHRSYFGHGGRPSAEMGRQHAERYMRQRIVPHKNPAPPQVQCFIDDAQYLRCN